MSLVIRCLDRSASRLLCSLKSRSLRAVSLIKSRKCLQHHTVKQHSSAPSPYLNSTVGEQSAELRLLGGNTRLLNLGDMVLKVLPLLCEGDGCNLSSASLHFLNFCLQVYKGRFTPCSYVSERNRYETVLLHWNTFDCAWKVSCIKYAAEEITPGDNK